MCVRKKQVLSRYLSLSDSLCGPALRACRWCVCMCFLHTHTQKEAAWSSYWHRDPTHALLYIPIHGGTPECWHVVGGITVCAQGWGGLMWDGTTHESLLGTALPI